MVKIFKGHVVRVGEKTKSWYVWPLQTDNSPLFSVYISLQRKYQIVTRNHLMLNNCNLGHISMPYSWMNPFGFPLLCFFLCVLLQYVWELDWHSVICSPRSSCSTVCRSKSDSLCVPGFSLGLQGHLVKTEQRGPIVLDTVTQLCFSISHFNHTPACCWLKRKRRLNFKISHHFYIMETKIQRRNFFFFTSAITTFLSQVWMLCFSFLCLSLTWMYSVISGAWYSVIWQRRCCLRASAFKSS